MTTLTIRDESATGKTLRATKIELPDEQITLEKLMEGYVFQQVKDFNLERADSPCPEPLFIPDRDEITLNGTAPTESRSIDWQAEFEKTKQAFRNQQILAFVNEQQIDSLDAVLTIGPSTDVKFLRLTMLMGG